MFVTLAAALSAGCGGQAVGEVHIAVDSEFAPYATWTRVELGDAVTIAPFGTTVPYNFVGHAPDSMRTDADGNVYVAMYQQGRVMVFNDNGIPIGQILLPGRDSGHNLRSTSLAFVPGTNEVLIVTNDATGGEGSWIFRAKGFAKGATLFSHQ